MTELNFEQLKQDFDRDGFVVLRGYRSPPFGISLWMALNHIDLHNGCLHYEKGSHKRDKPFGQPIAYPPPDYDQQNANAVPVEVEPGDAVMHTALTVHWSIDPIEYRDRNAMVFVYWGASSAVDPMWAKKSRSAYADGTTTL